MAVDECEAGTGSSSEGKCPFKVGRLETGVPMHLPFTCPWQMRVELGEIKNHRPFRYDDIGGPDVLFLMKNYLIGLAS